MSITSGIVIKDEYLALLRKKFDEAYEIAGKARAKGFDPELEVEVVPTEDVAARVEEIVGPKGVSTAIREAVKTGRTRELVAYDIAKRILKKEFCEGTKEELIEQAVRTGVAILTEGVLVAPTEGISKIIVKTNPDGSDYLSIYFSGPIRSAGGTVAALAVVLADVARREMGVSDYRPTEDEVERYVEEVLLYDVRGARLQYRPTEDEIRHIIRNCPVCIDGDPTEEFEVSVHKGLARVETDRVRGGIALVIGEGIAQKAAKVMKYTKKIKLNWEWIQTLVKVGKKEGSVTEIKPNEKFLDDLVAGRPIFAYPSRPGGFRLRYGRCRTSGIAGKSIHPATMVILDEFIAVGTQMKVERPGKGCVMTPCDSIEGPIVKLHDGSVLRVSSVSQAREIAAAGKVEEILFLGDILVTVGDFSKANHPLAPSGYCEEWWNLELAALGRNVKDVNNVSIDEAIKLAEEEGKDGKRLPLHPKFTYFWHDLQPGELRLLAEWLAAGRLDYGMLGGAVKSLSLKNLGNEKAKRVLEILGVPHKVKDGESILEDGEAVSVLRSLGILQGRKLGLEKFNSVFSEEKSALENVNNLSGFVVRKKVGIYIGGRMGRPEKAKEREMKPAPHVLFPLGNNGGKLRSVLKAYKSLRERTKEKGVVTEVVRLRCMNCGELGITNTCKCGGRTQLEKFCIKCGRTTDKDKCPADGSRTSYYDERAVDIVELFDKAVKKCNGFMPNDMKGVVGLVSAYKIPEPLEKGFLRAKHGIYTFKDGTCRFDATDVPITHFKPKEIGISFEQAKGLGYLKDCYGNELKNDEQLCELRPQDILLADRGAEYMINVSKFVDDELVYLYGLPQFYNVKERKDLVGRLVITLSPHTSAGVLSRIIGFTKARVGYAHPYLITCRRRNCDGDEDTTMLLMDALLNFSKKFLPSSRGGTMDAPRVVTTLIDPSEVDDEVHSMEVCQNYSLEFYDATQRLAGANEIPVERVADRLGKEGQYHDLWFTHETSSIDDAPTITRYVQFESMQEKIESQLALSKKIRAVDEKDAAERVILSHFLPDLYGNLRSFSKQTFRCVDCNKKYRRVPLVGKCPKCGGKILLTINKGGIEKYLKISQKMCARFELSGYLIQRLNLIEKEIASVFAGGEEAKQFNLGDFM